MSVKLLLITPLNFKESTSPLQTNPGQIYNPLRMTDPSQYKFSCSICDKKFKQKQHAQRHERTVHGDVSHKCEICNASFNQLSNLTRHINTHKKRPLENVSYNVNPKRPCISQEKSEHLSEYISKCN